MAENFYRAVTQAVLLLDTDTWVLSMTMDRTVEGTHTGFLGHIAGKRERWKADGVWVTPRAEVVWEAAGTQSAMTYIGRRQGMVSQWVALSPIS